MPRLVRVLPAKSSFPEPVSIPTAVFENVVGMLNWADAETFTVPELVKLVLDVSPRAPELTLRTPSLLRSRKEYLRP